LDGSHAKIILYQLLKAIRDLRAANVVHRDLKPENIIFNNTDCKIHQNSLKLVDFGFSVLCQEEAKFIHRRCGTPGFASPEVLNLSQEATPEVCVNSDIYSAGLIFYFMLTGIMAFDGNDTLDILKNNKKAKLDF
jgi:serine/threonine protein kinase